METKVGHQDKASVFRTVQLKAGRLESIVVTYVKSGEFNIKVKLYIS